MSLWLEGGQGKVRGKWVGFLSLGIKQDRGQPWVGGCPPTHCHTDYTRTR